MSDLISLEQRARPFDGWQLIDLVAAMAFGVVAALLVHRGFDGGAYAWDWRGIPRAVVTTTPASGLVPGPLLSGLGMTLLIVLASFALMIPVALASLALARLGTPAMRLIARIHVEVSRNTPALVQLYLVYFIVAPVFDIPRFWSLIVALAIFEGAFAAEILRGGLMEIPPGQWEAARSLGLTRFDTFSRIVLPQLLRSTLPGLGGQTIALLKASSLGSVIGLLELTAQTRTLVSNSFLVFEYWTVAALVYFALAFAISRSLGVAEQRLRLP